mmetsp:Transcript_33131/g.54701  ORF Transcript_33131/g.54701 Transcript_33131/m.54701 type:complete len:548 (+) Transcript_33131:55-1698(+)|eukprot:CAMPEP_0119009218 /NCGR_PEP_ID=MMETSP1176-20130426/4220_1 /TAXON_ID=265551 /ORGANISM="Synedropsis recta cf, Strain CCMP1620" /LENGTH=547 /DNA_ID=CAMNT_0006961687 /DNA_START=30 /DNA_END=1673 /DNA_ORIENTATION=-
MSTSRTKTGWRSTFQFYDSNGNGTISTKELEAAFKSLGESYSNEEVEQMLADFGMGEADSLDFENFVKLLEKNSQSLNEITRSELQEIYYTIDIDWSGYITGAELKHFLTKMNIDMTDTEMEEMLSIYDLDGNGQLPVSEFESILKSFGYTIIEDAPDETMAKATATSVTAERKTQPTGKSIKVSELPNDVKDALGLFDFNNTGEIFIDDLKNAADLLRTSLMKTAVMNPEKDCCLHWEEDRDKRGLGKVIYKANHIAFIVSDVGRSVRFYADVMGFQQIRRPNFDKNGAWFTMGNVELHLIKGEPLVHSGDDLIVNHISIETYEIDLVPRMLKRMGIPFRQNVSVPKGEDGGGEGTNESNENDKIVRQYFFRDPDGYYMEVCNCQQLTSYCLGEETELAGYDEGVRPLSLGNSVVAVNLMQKWSGMASKNVQNRSEVLEEVKKTDGSAESIASVLGYTKADVVDETILLNLVTRMSIYGDICQSETEESIKEILMLAGNSPADADELMHIKAENAGFKIFQPPAFYEQGEILTKPPPIIFTPGEWE